MEERWCQKALVHEYRLVLQELIQKVGKNGVSGRAELPLSASFSLKVLMMSLKKESKKNNSPLMR